MVKRGCQAVESDFQMLQPFRDLISHKILRSCPAHYSTLTCVERPWVYTIGNLWENAIVRWKRGKGGKRYICKSLQGFPFNCYKPLLSTRSAPFFWLHYLCLTGENPPHQIATGASSPSSPLQAPTPLLFVLYT